MNLEVTCTRKNDNYDQNTKLFASEITFQPVSTAQSTGFSTGAVIGTPNAPHQSLPTVDKVSYTLNGSLILVVDSQDEAAKYSVGGVYDLIIQPKSSPAKK